MDNFVHIVQNRCGGIKMKSQNLIREVDEAGRKLKELMAFSNQFPERGSTMKRTIEELSGELERIRHSAEEIVSEKKRAAKDRKPKERMAKVFRPLNRNSKLLPKTPPTSLPVSMNA